MARSIWSGFLSFGLVSVPIGLYPATADQTIHFNQLHKGTSHRIRYKKVERGHRGGSAQTRTLSAGMTWAVASSWWSPGRS